MGKLLGDRPMAIEGGPNPGRGQTGKTLGGNNNSGSGAKKPEPEGKKPQSESKEPETSTDTSNSTGATTSELRDKYKNVLDGNTAQGFE